MEERVGLPHPEILLSQIPMNNFGLEFNVLFKNEKRNTFNLAKLMEQNEGLFSLTPHWLGVKNKLAWGSRFLECSRERCNKFWA